MSLTYSECVSVALVTQHAMRMRRVMSPVGLAVPLRSTLSNKTQNFRKNILNMTCVLVLSTDFV
jgi:hypothetical protein